MCLLFMQRSWLRLLNEIVFFSLRNYLERGNIIVIKKQMVQFSTKVGVFYLEGNRLSKWRVSKEHHHCGRRRISVCDLNTHVIFVDQHTALPPIETFFFFKKGLSVYMQISQLFILDHKGAEISTLNITYISDNNPSR